MELSRITDLTIRYLKKEITLAERAELDEWLGQSPVNRERFDRRVEEHKLAQSLVIIEDGNDLKESMRAQIVWEQEPVRKLRPSWRRVAVAAVFIPLTGICLLVLWLYKGRRIAAPQQAIAFHDLLPGGNKAVLTLADGATITLDSTGIGAITRQGTMQVTKLDSGEIAYRGSAVPGNDVLYNSISTPRGGQYRLVLADGSKVWLNAASTLRYPATFTGTNRTVELLQGEAYFEVVHATERPFIVRVPASGAADKELAVQVLGTSFDVNAYPDEPDTKTTLVSGAVRVAKGEQVILLHPGQQARTNANSRTISIDGDVDISGVVAWKDGLFSFNRAGIEAVMRQLARWYDVDVSYEGAVPIRQFVGTIPRNMLAADVLKALELNNVHFKIEGRKIIVTP